MMDCQRRFSLPKQSIINPTNDPTKESQRQIEIETSEKVHSHNDAPVRQRAPNKSVVVFFFFF